MLISGLTLFVLSGCATSPDEKSEVANVTINTDPNRPLVGVSYFAGWWPPPRSKWQTPRTGVDWREKFPERVPLLGEYNSQETMDQEIVAAASHGVDFFAILWYPPSTGDSQWPLLNRGLGFFLASPESRRMRFVVEFCNHAPFTTKTDAEWDACIAAWMPVFKHALCLRVDGRLVFKIHSIHQFYLDSGENLDIVAARIAKLRKAVRDAGLGEMVIGAGGMGQVGKDDWPVKSIDFSGDYMLVPSSEKADSARPIEELANFLRSVRLERAGNAIPYMPVIAAGWDPRPWNDPRPFFAMPTAEQWTAELRRLNDDLAVSTNLGIPRRDGKVAKAFTIYAWNEFGEGGILAPTRGERDTKLRGIRDVLGVAPPPEPVRR